ncbi:MAG: hypothetical protein U0893_18360 [Chloroflexota bacterium]
MILSRRRALAALLVAAQLPLLVGMAEAEQQQPAAPPLPPNNIVGLNLARRHQPQYIRAAGDVVNANGGAWGYVTILFTRQDRDAELAVHALQQVLDRCFEARLQPIVRVATQFDEQSGIWDRPTDDEPARWRALFEQVRWPNRLVWIIPANEPNLGREWGGQVDVPSYARYLDRFMNVFEGADRLRVVNAPMNLSNPHKLPEMQDAFDFLAEQADLTPGIFERLPAWATNSYRVDGFGDGVRFTHRGYEAELEFIGRDMPVIVAESGVLKRHDQDEVARFFVQAYRDWQNDRRVIAATPLFWDPDVDDQWMFTLDNNGMVQDPSATYRALRELPRVAGSAQAGPAVPNSARVTASAVKTRPLPIFLPDPPSSGEGSRNGAP